MSKSVIIVGAGIAGLSAGCYARMNGYETTIFEMHSIPGGLCTAWKRKDYKWDISMHMLTNSRSGPFHKMWEELDVMKNRQFYYHNEFVRIEGKDKSITMGMDAAEVKKAMMNISPADAKLIQEFAQVVYGKSMMDVASLNPPELSDFRETLKTFFKVLPLMPTLFKYSKTTVQDFAKKFSDPFLQKAVQFTIDSPGWRMIDFPMVAMNGMAEAGVKNAGVPLGGSQEVVFGISKKFKQLGGQIHFKKRVQDLIIENGKVTGIKLESGEEHRAEMVIWAADGHHLIFDILKEKYISDEIRNMYEKWIPVLSLVHVMIGVNRDMSKEPSKLIFELDAPIKVADEDHKWLTVIQRNFDPSMAPAGKSAVEVWFTTKDDYWTNLEQDRKRYEQEKDRIAKECIAALNKRWPGFTKQVEVIDVPTPATYKRYTGNWKASPDGWYVTPANMTKQNAQRTLPGLDGLYMVGQWTAPFTGTVIAALSGRQAVQIMCKKDGKKFQVS